MRHVFWLMLATFGAAAMANLGGAQEYMTGLEWHKPPIIEPPKEPGGPPSDATILFDGKDFSAWNGAETWKIEDGVMVVGKNYIETKEHFGDSQLHVEWSAPTPPVGTSQGRGNSGVFFGAYELQVLDSYENETYYDGQAAAIYKQQPPMVNAMRPPAQWNVYDILWTAPRYGEDGKLKSPAHITVLHNGVAVQNHFELLGDTPFQRPPQYVPPTEQPVRLQDHGNPVKFRNIWIRPLKKIEGKRVREPYMRVGDKEIPLKLTGSVSGKLWLDGRPVDAANLALYSHGMDSTHWSTVREGAFWLNGVVPGDYSVSVTGDPGGKAKIPERYVDRDKSPITVSVLEGKNEFNLELSSR